MNLLLKSLVYGGGLWLVVCGITLAEEKDPAVARARKQVQMLDDLYKTAVVLVTEHYVNSDTDLAAGSAFKALFKVMKEKGHHEARLVDATGNPYEPTNAPRAGFETEAIAAIKAGKPYVDQVVEKNGKRFLQAATTIPVVMKKCTLCHPHYEKAKPGEAIGALLYVIPVE